MATYGTGICRRLVFTKSTLLKPNKLLQASLRNVYYVLLPEVTTDSPETNPILRSNCLSSIEDVNPLHCMNGISKLIGDCNEGIVAIEEFLRGKSKVKFEDVFDPLEKLTTPLDLAWCVIRQKLMTQYSDDISTVYNKLYPLVQKAKTQRFHSSPIYNAAKNIANEASQLDFVKQRIVKKYLTEGRLNALSLSGNAFKHFVKASENVNENKQKFRQNVNEAHRRFRHIIKDYDKVSNFPENLLKAIASDKYNPTVGPWTITLDDFVYNGFLRHCKDRDLRHNTWRAFNFRASAYNDSKINNSLPIEEIRFNRHDIAQLLGFESYSHLSMTTKMAGNLETVHSMITSLKAKSGDVMKSDFETLQKFAEAHGFTLKLELWDLPYWRQQYRDEIYGVDEDELRCYFPFDHVLQRLFDLCHTLFNITIKDETSNARVWASDMKFYNVHDENGAVIGSFYLDPFARSGKRKTGFGLDNGIARCDSLGIKPLAFLNFNFPPSSSTTPSLLSFDDVTLLLQKFGSALQLLCTKIPNIEVSGTNNLEWDVVNVCPYFMSFWLRNETILKSFTCHYQNSQPLSDNYCTNIIKARQHFAAFDLTYELYLSALDLDIYLKRDYWLDITRSLWSEYLPQYSPMDKQNTHPSSFSLIFSEGFAASYFSFTWAKMIAADVFRSFEETGLENESEIKAKGKRFRETFLALGGGCHPSEVFRLFRGRDPSPACLLLVEGITNNFSNNEFVADSNDVPHKN